MKLRVDFVCQAKLKIHKKTFGKRNINHLPWFLCENSLRKKHKITYRALYKPWAFFLFSAEYYLKTSRDENSILRK